MRIASVLSAVLFFAPVVLSSTIFVPDDYPTIQEAITMSVNGDTIIVRPGRYDEKVEFGGKAVTLRSELGPHATSIENSGSSSCVQFRNGEGRKSILEGFTIKNGKGTRDGHSNYGGGIFCKNVSPIIRYNIIKGNKCSGGGGGIGCRGTCEPLIQDNRIINNSAAYSGGAIFCSGGEIRENIISANTSTDWGGGIATHAVNARHLLIEGNTITENFAQEGGGISVIRSSDRVISRNTIASNRATEVGGGIYFFSNASPVVADNIISENVALDGGGIACYASCSPLLTNNTIVGNRAGYGGGIYCSSESNIAVIHCTLSNNSAYSYGGGICSYQDCDTSIVNTILWGNVAPNGAEVCLGNQFHPSTSTISSSDVSGGQAGVFIGPLSILNWGFGNIDADPLFIDAANGDVHIPFDSPCRSAGDRNAPNLPDTDFEGDPRTGLFAFPDIGADEFHTHFYINGTISSGNPATGVIIGWPRTSPVVLISGSAVNPNPEPTPYGDFWLLPPWKHRVHFNAIPNNGVRLVERVMSIGLSPGTEIPVQALIGKELSNLWVLRVE